MASDLGLHCLHMPHKKDAKHTCTWVKMFLFIEKERSQYWHRLLEALSESSFTFSIFVCAISKGPGESVLLCRLISALAARKGDTYKNCMF